MIDGDDPHGDYVPPVVGEDDDKDEEFLAAELSDNELMAGDYEVEDLQGNITIVRGPSLSKEEEKTKDDTVLALATADQRHHDHPTNRKIRFSNIINNGVSHSNLPSS